MMQGNRIFGLETEHGFSFRPVRDGRSPEREAVFAALCEALDEKCPSLPEPEERRFIRFLANGAKCYYDTGLLEWSTPECRSLRDLIACDKAGEQLISEIVVEAERLLARQGFEGRLFVAKNNVDALGNTYGCHENYLLSRSPDLLDNQQDFFRLIVRQLVPFLVTRQILCGAGKVGPWLNTRDRALGYHVSQRAEFIGEVVSPETRFDRGIVNMRDEAQADPARFRRLHLILGDANLCEYSTFLKVGTTAIVLSMIEDQFITEDLALMEPRLSINQISYDPTCRRTIELRNGTRATAIAIQRRYLDLARTYFAHETLDAETQSVLYEWADTLDKLGRDTEELTSRVDWLIKLHLLRARGKKVAPGAEWSLERGDHWEHPALRELDLKYHVLRPEQSLYAVLERAGLVDHIVTPEEIARARKFPPCDTRAKIRGDAIWGTLRKHSLALVDWEQIMFPGVAVALLDPRDFFDPLVQAQVQDPRAEAFLCHRLADPNSEVRRRAALALGALGSPTAYEPLLARLQDPAEEVRAAAARGLGQLHETRATAALQQARQDSCFQVRKAAEWALSRLSAGEERAWR